MDLTGRKIRVILQGDRFYSGEVLEENDISYTIKDKYAATVLIGKASIISMEVLNE